jgi:hypothetical protein
MGEPDGTIPQPSPAAGATQPPPHGQLLVRVWRYVRPGIQLCVLVTGHRQDLQMIMQALAACGDLAVAVASRNAAR